jgi:hypothetical protein
VHIVLGTTEHWLAVTDEIRRGRSNVQRLTLGMLEVTTSESSEAVKTVASAIRLDYNLEHLTLEIENGFTDEAGVALAEALTVNQNLYKITLSDFLGEEDYDLDDEVDKSVLGVQAYKAFSAMLRVNTSLVLKLPPFEAAGVDARRLETRNEIFIEERLNQVGRGRLLASSIQTTREEWVDALHELSTYDVNDSYSFDVSCLYCLLRLNPAICMLKADG